MKKIELAPGIMVYSDVLEDHGQFFIDFEEAMSSGVTNLKWQPPMVLRDGQSLVDYHVRSLDTFGIDYDQSKSLVENPKTPYESFINSVGNKFYTAFDPCEKDYQNHYGSEMVWHDMYNILRYGKDHFFVNHIDDNQTFHRRISCVYYGNDDYSGGEILFDRFNIQYKPKANELLIFPSTYVYNHSVNKVIEGTRYAVASWLN